MGSELEKRITILEDIEAIKKLKARYCAVCDDNHNPDEIIRLFAEDGVWEGAGVGEHRQVEQVVADVSYFRIFERVFLLHLPVRR